MGDFTGNEVRGQGKLGSAMRLRCGATPKWTWFSFSYGAKPLLQKFDMPTGQKSSLNSEIPQYGDKRAD